MRTKNENLPTAERLQIALVAISEPLQSEIFMAYHLMNPISLAEFLISLEIGNDNTREILLTKVSEPKKYRGPSLDVLLDKAVENFWNRRSTEHAGSEL